MKERVGRVRVEQHPDSQLAKYASAAGTLQIMELTDDSRVFKSP